MAHPQRKPRLVELDEECSGLPHFRTSEVPNDLRNPRFWFIRPLVAAATVATGIALLVHFTGWLIALAIVAGIVGTLAYLMNGVLDDVVDL